MRFKINLGSGAEQDLSHYKPGQQQLILEGIERFLSIDAEIQTKRRKQMRPNPIAPWELRPGDHRVFYSIEDVGVVTVLAIGHKRHNVLLIRGRRVEL